MNQVHAIVIVAYNRPLSLARLLQSVGAAVYHTTNIPLIISIDKSDNKEVSRIAETFEWKYGTKEIIYRPERLGLRRHILECGDISLQKGSVIILEDDLLVSPYFYLYAQQANEYYAADDNIMGISLYSYKITENKFVPFHPLFDGSDTYFMQLPSSWGELFTAQRWQSFRNWNAVNDNIDSLVPPYIKVWGEKSWKKRLIAYMIAHNKYFAFPHISYTTNFGDYGENTDRRGIYHVSLAMQSSLFNFKPFSESKSVYDASFEIMPAVLNNYVPALQGYNYTVDLYGIRKEDEIKTPYLLSSKHCKSPVISFGNNLHNPIQSVIFNDAGKFFSLGKKEDFTFTDVDTSYFHNYINDIVKPFPRLLYVIIGSDPALVRNSLNSIYNQNYPNIEVVVLSKNNLDIGDTEITLYNNAGELFLALSSIFHNSQAMYCSLMQAGEELHLGACNAMRTVFNSFPTLPWFTGILTLKTPAGFHLAPTYTAHHRWSKKKFEQSIYKNNGEYIAPAATIFSKNLWLLCRPHINFVSEESMFNDLWAAFFNVQDLYTVGIYISSIPYPNEKVSPAKKILRSLQNVALKNKYWLSEYLFLKNIPVLRYMYRRLFNLPQIIRYNHKIGFYYLSDY